MSAIGLSIGLPFTRFSGVDENPPSAAPALAVYAELGSPLADLTWTASNRIASPGFGYRVELNYNAGGFNSLTTLTGLSYTDSQTGGLECIYRIIPYNDYGEGPSSNEVTVILPGESEGPVLTGPEFALNDTYTLEWTSVAGATSYDLYYSRDDTSYALLANIATLTYDVTFDFPGMYHYVIAKNGAFESAPSNTHLVTLLIPANSYYLRPDGVSYYLRPDGTSKYLRP